MLGKAAHEELQLRRRIPRGGLQYRSSLMKRFSPAWRADEESTAELRVGIARPGDAHDEGWTARESVWLLTNSLGLRTRASWVGELTLKPPLATPEYRFRRGLSACSETSVREIGVYERAQQVLACVACPKQSVRRLTSSKPRPASRSVRAGRVLPISPPTNDEPAQ